LNHLANTVEKPEHETIVYKKTTVHSINHDVIRNVVWPQNEAIGRRNKKSLPVENNHF